MAPDSERATRANSEGNRGTETARTAAPVPAIQVGLLTGGDDRSYALGLTMSLAARGVFVDFVGSDRVDSPELHHNPLVNFLNLRGDQREDAPFRTKVVRLLTYYLRLLKYAVVAEPRIFHILWNNKFELFDRTLLMLFYRALGRKIVFTAHNVNAGKRDGRDSALNRLSLRVQYLLANQIFVHTERMKKEMEADFGIAADKITVIPFGINNTAPMTDLSPAQAKGKLGVRDEDHTALFFGQIAPYKGLKYLVQALPELVSSDPQFRLIIAGKVKRGSENYWREVEGALSRVGARERVITRIEHIPDQDIELYFKAADVLVIPYTEIFQSGVPFLAYGFGLPVIATDVGSLREDIVEGVTGLVCRPRDPGDLARTMKAFFSGDVYSNRSARRSEIRNHASEHHSWGKVGEVTESVYRRLLGGAMGQPDTRPAPEHRAAAKIGD